MLYFYSLKPSSFFRIHWGFKTVDPFFGRSSASCLQNYIFVLAQLFDTLEYKNYPNSTIMNKGLLYTSILKPSSCFRMLPGSLLSP